MLLLECFLILPLQSHLLYSLPHAPIQVGAELEFVLKEDKFNINISFYKLKKY